jgi:putative membrane protein
MPELAAATTEPHQRARCLVRADANEWDQKMATDLYLAIAHHLLIFVLFGILVSELVLTRQSMTGNDIRRLASIDFWYGIVALLILIVGFSRAIFAAKGWAYYSVNSFLWAKIGVFVLIALLSIWPTVKYLNWRRNFRNANSVPDALSVSGVRRILWLELVLFPFLPAFAAAMARGYGE